MTTVTFHSFFKVQETTEFDRMGKNVGYFHDEATAKQASRHYGSWGGDGSVTPVSLVKIDDQYFELARPAAVEVGIDLIKAEKDREAAVLAKLSPEDIAVLTKLGLKVK